MSMKTAVRSVATPADQATLSALMAEPEAALSDAPLYNPQALGALLLEGALLLSPKMPKEPGK